MIATKKIGAILVLLICLVYVLNPTAGVFELLPDNIPFFGNIDEGLAFALIFASIRYLRTGKFALVR